MMYFFKAEVVNYKGDLNTPPDQVKFSNQSEKKSWTSTNQAERKKKTNFVGKKMRMGKCKGGGDESSDENDWWSLTTGLFEDIWSLWSMSRDPTINDHFPCWWAVLIVVLHCTVIALSFLHIWNPDTRRFKSEYSNGTEASIKPPVHQSKTCLHNFVHGLLLEKAWLCASLCAYCAYIT